MKKCTSRILRQKNCEGRQQTTGPSKLRDRKIIGSSLSRSHIDRRKHLCCASILCSVVLPLVCLLVPLQALAGSAIPGGVTGTVYCRADSLDPPWAPQSDVFVLVEAVEGDSVPTPREVTVTVRDTRLEPTLQVALPGAPLRIVSRSSRIQTVVAETEAGERLFSIALPMPGLEVMKRLDDEGFLSIYPKDGGVERGASILVLSNMGSAVTDTAGTFLIAGIPPGCRALWAFDPVLGSVSDSVCIEPVRAEEIDLYLPHVPGPSDESSRASQNDSDHDIVR